MHADAWLLQIYMFPVFSFTLWLGAQMVANEQVWQPVVLTI